MTSFEGRLTRVTDDVSGIDMSCRFRGALFAIFCMFVSVRPTSAYALDFARHSIDSNKLNAILVTAEVRTGERPMNKVFAYGISTIIVCFGLSMLIVDLSSTAPAALWVITALIPIAIGILSAFGPV